MTTIFISGSREIPFLPDEVKSRVDRMIGSGMDIVVGDSERGVDAIVLRYLESRSYENVSVYTIHDVPRAKNRLDSWNICKVDPSAIAKMDKEGKIRNRRELETAKDEEMGRIADYGLVVWQSTYKNRFGRTSVSKGSLRNMYQMLSSQKPVVLYEASEDDADDTAFRCHELKSIEDLQILISSKSDDAVKRAYAQIEKADIRSNLSLFD